MKREGFNKRKETRPRTKGQAQGLSSSYKLTIRNSAIRPRFKFFL